MQILLGFPLKSSELEWKSFDHSNIEVSNDSEMPIHKKFIKQMTTLKCDF